MSERDAEAKLAGGEGQPVSADPPTIPAAADGGEPDSDRPRKRSRRTLRIPDDATPAATPPPEPVAASPPAPAAEDLVIMPMRIISIASDLPAMEEPPPPPEPLPPAPPPPAQAAPPPPDDDDDDDPLAKTIERAPRDAATTVKIEAPSPAAPSEPVLQVPVAQPPTQPDAPEALAASSPLDSESSAPTLVRSRNDLDWTEPAEEIEEVEPERVSLPEAPTAPRPPPPRSTPMPARAPSSASPPPPPAEPKLSGEEDVLVDTDEPEAPTIPKRPPPPPPRKAPAAAPSAPETITAPRVKPWWEELFADDYIRTLDEPDQQVVNHDVDFIEQSLGVEAGAVILDLGSGDGRHAIELSRRGYSVVGFDLSLAMLARAAENAQARGQRLNFLQGDMREMGFEDMFDGVYCWQTSFGYFEEEKNVEVLRRMHRALKSGGVLLLDVVNRDYVAPRQPSMVWYEGDACVCMDEMKVDFLSSRLRVKRTVMFDDGRSRELDYNMRLYSLHELGRILHDVGFRVIEVTGHTAHRGVFFGSESPRLIVLAERD